MKGGGDGAGQGRGSAKGWAGQRQVFGRDMLQISSMLSVLRVGYVAACLLPNVYRLYFDDLLCILCTACRLAVHLPPDLQAHLLAPKPGPTRQQQNGSGRGLKPQGISQAPGGSAGGGFGATAGSGGVKALLRTLAAADFYLEHLDRRTPIVVVCALLSPLFYPGQKGKATEGEASAGASAERAQEDGDAVEVDELLKLLDIG